MEANGTTLSLLVASFPPLFKGVIPLLKTHGSNDTGGSTRT
jgi:hypothetical protein